MKTEAILMKVNLELKKEIDEKAQELQMGAATYCRMVVQKEITRLKEVENEKL